MGRGVSSRPWVTVPATLPLIRGFGEGLGASLRTHTPVGSFPGVPGTGGLEREGKEGFVSHDPTLGLVGDKGLDCCPGPSLGAGPSSGASRTTGPVKVQTTSGSPAPRSSPEPRGQTFDRPVWTDGATGRTGRPVERFPGLGGTRRSVLRSLVRVGHPDVETSGGWGKEETTLPSLAPVLGQVGRDRPCGRGSRTRSAVRSTRRAPCLFE